MIIATIIRIAIIAAIIPIIRPISVLLLLLSEGVVAVVTMIAGNDRCGKNNYCIFL